MQFSLNFQFLDLLCSFFCTVCQDWYQYNNLLIGDFALIKKMLQCLDGMVIGQEVLKTFSLIIKNIQLCSINNKELILDNQDI